MLDRSGTPVTRRDVGEWRRSTSLGDVRDLCLWGCSLDDDAAAALGETPLPSLLHAQLGFNRIGPDGARALARAAWPRMTSLLLYENEILADGLSAVLAGPRAAHLSELNVCGNALGPDGARALAHGAPKRLAVLHAGFNSFGSEGAEAILAAAPSTLVELNLRLNDIAALGDRALQTLRASSLVKLSLEDNPLEAESLDRLALHLPASLRSLHVGGVGPQVARLARAPAAAVVDLDLSHDDLDDEALAALLAAPLLSTVRRLNLAGNPIGAGGARAVVAHRPPALEEVWLDDDHARALDALRPFLARRPSDGARLCF